MVQPKLFIDVTKKQLKQSANRYKDTYNELFNNLPKWKQSAIIEDVAANKNSGILVDFIKSVIELAEREELELNEKKVLPTKKVAVKSKVHDSLDEYF